METSQINHQKDGGSAGEGKHALAAHTLAVTTTPEHTEIARKHGSKPKQKHQKKKKYGSAHAKIYLGMGR